MLISLIQLDLTHNILENFRKHEYYINNEESDLIIFPECSLTGYNANIFKKVAYKKKYQRIKEVVKRICHLAEMGNKSVVIGIPVLEDGKLFNCGCLITPTGQLYQYKKISLTEEEKDIFYPGENILIFKLQNKKFGLVICRDQSNVALFNKLLKKNIDYLIIQSAHYYEPDIALWKRYKNIAIPITRAMDYGITILKVNTVGMLYGRISLGNSLVVNGNGRVLGMCDDINEGVLRLKI